MNRILIVDDEKDNLQALMRLMRNDYEVVTTTSPFDALKLLQKETFSVIISDQRMPEMKGVELLEKAKQIAPYTTRILLTGYTEADSVIEAINRGNIYRYVAKPWDSEDLKMTVRQASEASRLRREVEDKNRELTQALQNLQKLDQAKTRFMSLISHELHTPLTVISSYLTILTEKTKALGEDGVKAVDAISKASLRLSDIVSEVLTYVGVGLETELETKREDLVPLFQRVLTEAQLELDEKKLKWNVKQPSEKLIVPMDSTKVMLALLRLLKEMGSHAPQNSEIKVTLKTENESAVIEVWRSGEVMDSAAFDPLEFSGSQLHHKQSLGLGLALGKLILEAHGGSFELSSDSASGTRVTYTLPL